MWPFICTAGRRWPRYFSAFLNFRLFVPVCTIAHFDRWVGTGSDTAPAASAKDDATCDIYVLPPCVSTTDDGDYCGDVTKTEGVNLNVVLEVCRRTFSEVVELYFAGVEEIRVGLYCRALLLHEYV